jgi:hypothetical protein
MRSKLTQLANERTSAQLQVMSRESIKWLTKKINALKNPSGIASIINREDFRKHSRFQLGGLYYFYYDPKTKNSLDYYDRFPLVLVLDKDTEGFTGLNLHYLPVKYRIALLDKLMDFASLDSNNDIKRLKVTYEILNGSKRFREFKPCLKKYLYGHVQSKMLAVQSNEWDIAVYLPIQQFKKASVNEVWEDSINEIRKN